MAVADATKPILLSLALPQLVDVTNGDAVAKFAIGATDGTGSGIESALLYFDLYYQGVQGRQAGVAFFDREDSFADNFSTRAELFRTGTPAGTYSVTQLSLTDRAGNTSYYNTDALKALGIDTDFTVASRVPSDLTEPTLTSLSLQQSIDVRDGGAFATFTARASDGGGTGIESVVLFLDGGYETAFGRQTSISFTDSADSFADGASTRIELFNQATPAGTYSVTFAYVVDNAGNYRYYYADDLKALGIDTDFVVLSRADADAAAPTLTGLDFQPVIDISNAAAAAQFTAAVTDTGGSGVASVNVYFDRTFQSGNGPSSGVYLADNQDSFDDGVSSRSVLFTTASAAGTYNITSVGVTDKAGNYTSYNYNELKALGLPAELTIVDRNFTPVPTIVVNAPASVIEGYDSGFTPSLTFKNPGAFFTQIEIGYAADATVSNGTDVNVQPQTSYFNRDEATPGDYVLNLAEISVYDDASAEGDETIAIRIKVPGQIFADGTDSTILRVALIDNEIDGTAGADRLTGHVGPDTIQGFAGNDSIAGGAGDDRVSGGSGSDVIDGGEGFDTLLLDGPPRDMHVRPVAGGYLVRDGYDLDRVTGFEQVSNDGGATALSFAEFEAQSFSPYAYLAAYADLRAAFGLNAEAARAHYFATGRAEGRDPGAFDGLFYAAANPDLARVFGLDGAAATLHYLRFGIAEGRPTGGFDPVLYAASNPDVARAFGTDANQLLRHDLAYGADEGRATNSFDAIEYGASNPDVVRAVGGDPDALAAHYVGYGLAEGRPTASFDPLLYAATNPDVARALGPDAAALTSHYVAYGIAEGRAATGFDAVAYLLSNPDLGNAGLEAAGALRHWVDFGVDEGRIGDSLFGREQASHAATAEGATLGTIDQAGDLDWYSITLHAGETVTLDLASDQSGDPANRGLPDPVMTLFDARGRAIAFDDNNGPGRDAQIHYTATSDGLYYIEAAGANAFGFFDVGGYRLTVDSSLFG